MLQLRKLRHYLPKGTTNPVLYDSALTPNVVVPTAQELITNLDKYLKQIPKEDRYNLYCTLGHIDEKLINEPKKRTWVNQDLLFFDIDDITFDENDQVTDKYQAIVSNVLGLKHDEILTILSGHGLHLLVQLEQPFERDYFEKNKRHYQQLCQEINKKIKLEGLSGHADEAVFAPNRMFRLPETTNKKQNKPERTVKILNPQIKTTTIELAKLSGLPEEAKAQEQITETQLTYFKIDTKSVEAGCNFLKYVKEKGGNVNEPTWYAALSIVSRLENPSKLALKYSDKHPSYNQQATLAKLEQAKEASGPRTCASINKLYKKCDTCPNYKKVTSPIMLKSPDFIATAHSGFYLENEKGKLIPQYEDLRKTYAKEYPYTNVITTHTRFDQTHWKVIDDVWIESYAQEKFNPKPTSYITHEFKNLIKRTELSETSVQDTYAKENKNKINLANGVLDLTSMRLLEHSPHYGFKYTLPIHYNPLATCPTFDHMIEGISCQDKDLQANLIEFIGYSLSGCQPLADKIMVLTGEGQNGKSRFLKILQAMAGSCSTALALRDLKNTFHRQMLDGSLFNISEEVPSYSDAASWEDLKALASGADVTAAKKNKNPYTFTNRAKLILTCNTLPKGTDPTHGYFRRLLIVPFQATFSHEEGNIDVNIADRVIRSELPGVFNKAIQAYMNLAARQFEFTRSKTMSAELEKYRLDSDNIYRFSLERLTDVRPDDFEQGDEEADGIANDNLYKEYKLWVENEGEKPFNSTHFFKRLKRALKRTYKKEFETKVLKTKDRRSFKIKQGIYWKD